MSRPVDIEALLEHRPFVKRLALRLVRDEARADDVVQDAYVAALENPPRHGGALRAWLAAVVRKLAWTHYRSDQRRAKREQASRPPQPLPAPDEIVERAAWHQRLVNLVMELEEPYRSTLLLRFFEDLNSREIAEMQGVPAATVRTRVRRGVEQLRARLDAETEGGRSRWVGALLLFLQPVAPPPPAPAPKPVLPFVAGALGVLAIAVLVWSSRPPPETPRAPTPERRVPSDVLERMLAGPEVPPTPPRAEDRFVVTVLDRGRPVSGARVVAQRLPPGTWRFVAPLPWTNWGRQTTGADGRASWPDAPPGYVRVRVAAPVGVGDAVVHWPQEFESPLVVELRPVPPPRPRAERTVRWPLAPTLDRPTAGTPVRIRRVHDRPTAMRTPWGRVVSDAVVVDGLDQGEVPELLAIAPDGAFARLWAPSGADEGPPVAFARPPDLTVTVVDDDGRPVAGAHVALFDGTNGSALFPDGRTDARGRLRLPVYAAEPVEVRVRTMRRAAYRGVGRYDPAGGDGALVATLPRGRRVELRVAGGLPEGGDVFVDSVRLAPAEIDAADERLRFTARPRVAAPSVDVHLLAPGRLPLAWTIPLDAAAVAVRDATLAPAGALELHVGRASPRQPYHLVLVDEEGERLRRGPWAFRLYPGPDDVVRETMLPAGAFRVRDVVSGHATPSFVVEPGATVRLRLDLPARAAGEGSRAPEPPEARGAVQVVAKLQPAPAPPGPGETAPRVRFGDDARVATLDPDGTLRCAGLPPGRGPLWIDVPGYAPALVGDAALGEGTHDLGTVALWRGSAVRVRVLGRDGEPLPDLVVSARHDGALGYQRSLRTDGRAEAVLEGLGAGRFRLTAWERYTGHAVASRTIYLDGATRTTVELDLR